MQIAELFYSVRGEGFDKLSGQIKSVGSGFSAVGSTLTNKVTKPIMGVASSIIDTTMTFDKQMSKVSSVTGATGKDFTALREKAIEMGSGTSKTATEAAEAIEYMGLAGWDLERINESLEPVLRASEAGAMDLGLTSDLVTDSMSALGLEQGDLTKYLDIGANAQNNSNQSMQQFLEAMVIAGGTFKMFNVPLEEAGALLGILANRGFKGKEAGTALTSVMANLTSGTGQAGKAMGDLGIEVYDGNGKFRGMTTILKELNGKFDGMTEAQRNTYIQMIGGKTRTKELNALLNGTSEELDDLTDTLHDSDGALNKMAQTMQDNLAGQVTKLKSKLEGIAIQIGDRLTPYIRIAADVVQALADAFYALPTPIKDIIIIGALLVAAIGPILLVIGGTITAVGMLVGAIGTLGTVITTVGLPVIATIAGIAAGIVIWTTAITLVVAKLGIFKDALASLKAIISGDVQTMFNLLHKNFGMSAKDAGIWSERFGEIADKAKIVAKVITDNLSIAMGILGQAIGTLMSGGMADLNSGTQESKNMFMGMVTGIIKWGGELIDYLYKMLDAFGLIPTALKFSNNEIAGQYIELRATTDNHFQDLMTAQLMFNGEFTEANLAGYAKKLADTKTAMDAELALVLEQLNIRKEREIAGLTELFANSQALSQENEAVKLESLKAYYVQEEEGLRTNLARQKEILTVAFAEKRNLTANENAELTFLRESAGARQLTYIATSSAEQTRILEETKNLTIKISKEQAMGLITEANRAYDGVVKKATEKKNKIIQEAITQRDETGILSAEEAANIIKEAKWQYSMTTGYAEDTKNETINAAEMGSKGVITAKEKEARDVETQAQKIEKVLIQIWNDIKGKIPGIVKEMGKDIVTYIEDNKPAIVAAALRVGKALVQGIIDGIGSLMGSLAAKVASALTLAARAQSAATQPATTGRPSGRAGIYSGKQYADGVTNAHGGWAMVGEQGPELMYVPKGSDIYSNPETRGMMNSTPNIGGGQGVSGMNMYGDVIIDAHNVQDFTDVVAVLKGIKREKSMR